MLPDRRSAVVFVLLFQLLSCKPVSADSAYGLADTDGGDETTADQPNRVHQAGNPCNDAPHIPSCNASNKLQCCLEVQVKASTYQGSCVCVSHDKTLEIE